MVRTHRFYEVASIIQSYTYHHLYPHIDDPSDRKRHFIKIHFLNKGIDLIDLPSILRDRRVQETIPTYLKNLEIPIICYKYKKPIRGLLFNYNQLVSHLEVETTPSYS